MIGPETMAAERRLVEAAEHAAHVSNLVDGMAAPGGDPRDVEALLAAHAERLANAVVELLSALAGGGTVTREGATSALSHYRKVLASARAYNRPRGT